MSGLNCYVYQVLDLGKYHGSAWSCMSAHLYHFEPRQLEIDVRAYREMSIHITSY
jgi:hypothetical protein